MATGKKMQRSGRWPRSSQIPATRIAIAAAQPAICAAACDGEPRAHAGTAMDERSSDEGVPLMPVICRMSMR